MTADLDTRQVVLAVLSRIAPEIDPADIRDDEPLRNQVDLDSMDWLNFLLGIDKQLHVSIPESDYRSLRTLTDVIGYVEAHRAGTQRPGR
ncbi:acyl carrier protein [Mycolicibacter heraklionensis]|uniref:Acyl carrier protein n=1 Tax=Mycolicibacter heraklionensis TaxID=512402 RepID=A0A9X7WD14_9MYCO|nr:acyl carrier protein [Mycolicibacter heraklionensis]QZA05985.1 acyl carrier protein [Mycolicibacter heraklionensis]